MTSDGLTQPGATVSLTGAAVGGRVVVDSSAEGDGAAVGDAVGVCLVVGATVGPADGAKDCTSLRAQKTAPPPKSSQTQRPSVAVQELSFWMSKQSISSPGP